MSYIGKTPTVGNFQVCDAISVVNGQAAYTMQVDSVNVVPESANHMLVSLNGILQKPGSSFTVAGSTITFASALSTGDVIDFITLLGNVLDLGVPSDATVTNAKTNFTSTSSAAGLQIKGDGTTDGTLQLNCSQNSHGIKLASPAHSAGQSYKLIFPAGNVTAGKVLKVDSVSGSGTTGIGTMTFGDAGGTNTPNFSAYLSGDQSISAQTWTKVQIDTEYYDSASAYDHSTNHRFTVPSGQAGKYFFSAGIGTRSTSNDIYVSLMGLYKNGSIVSLSRMNSNSTGNAQFRGFGHTIATALDLSVGDYIEVYANIYGTSPKVETGSDKETYFQGFKIIE